MKPKHILAGVVVLFGLFFARELWISNDSLRVFGEEGFAVVQVPSGETIFFGESTTRKDVLLRAIQPYFSNKEPLVIADQEIGTSVEGSDFTITRISEHIVRGTFSNSTIWFYGSPSEDELTSLKATPITLESDFWILETNHYPEVLPLPTQSILHINERKPSKKLESFAREKNIPLVSVKGTGGFKLELRDQKWQMKSR
jgi:hypothetical protein